MTNEETKTDGKFTKVMVIVTFIIILVMILLFTGYYKKAVIFINPDLKNCEGTCKGSCTAGIEIQNNNVKCSNPSNVCCTKNNRTASPECNGRTKGDICGKLMLCDEDNVCVTRCEYCAINPDDAKCQITDGIVGNKIVSLDSSFSCGCSEMQCIEFDNSKLGTCVKNFCPSENVLATDYMCCTNPYK